MTTKISQRYAKALFDSTNKEKQYELLVGFKDLLNVYEKVPKLYFFLNSPEISIAQKENVLKLMFKEKIQFLEFLVLLMEKKRFKYFTSIAEEYRTIYSDSYGITYAHLTTAIPLNEDSKKRLSERLDHTYNKQFELICDVDPKIIGGGIMIIDDRMIDFSIRDKLNSLKSYLQK